MDILNIHPNDELTYSDPGFLVMIESHLTYLRGLSSNYVMTATNQQGFKYEGDFFGLLNELGIEKKYHHIVMRVNGYLSSADYKGDVLDIVIPSLDEVTLLKTTYQTSNS